MMGKVRSDTPFYNATIPSLSSFFIFYAGILAGGLMALYSLLCRNAKLSLLPNQQAADEELSTYHYPGYSNRNIPSSLLRRFIDKHKYAKTCLLLLVLLGACMVISVGVLSPAISGKGTFFTFNLLHLLEGFLLIDFAYLVCCSFCIH